MLRRSTVNFLNQIYLTMSAIKKKSHWCHWELHARNKLFPSFAAQGKWGLNVPEWLWSRNKWSFEFWPVYSIYLV